MGLFDDIIQAIDGVVQNLTALADRLRNADNVITYSNVKATTTTNLNLRSGPGTAHRVVTTIPQSATVYLLDGSDESKIGTMGEWVRVCYPRESVYHFGYVSAGYLKKAVSTPTYSELPAGEYCLVGVHGPADYEWTWAGANFDMIRTARVDAVKFLSGRGFRKADIDALRSINPGMFLLCRLMGKPTVPTTPKQFVDAVYPYLREYYDAGVRFFEVHNEPNLPSEGFGVNWADGAGFGRWFNEVVSLLRPQMPRARFGYPGLSPTGTEQMFLQQSLSVGLLADWFGLHVYWTDSPASGIQYAKQFVSKLPNLPVLITEFSNPSPSVSKTAKGQQYVEFYKAIREVSPVRAAFCFLLSASGGNFPYETWIGSDIPRIIGAARADGTLDRVCDGLDSPVGTPAERASAQMWPGKWIDATGYDTYYSASGITAYHTGADLNLNDPAFDLDKLSPVYACADGTVTFSGVVGGTWGSLIVIRHDRLPSGEMVWSRYGHVTDLLVQTGDRVVRGQQIARVGNAGGKVPYHLHFDIAVTDVLETNPRHWPGLDREAVRKNYANPALFISNNRPLRYNQTPFSGITIWHWSGSSVSPTVGFDDLLYPYAQFGGSSVHGFLVKATDGLSWQGEFDTNPLLRIRDANSIDRWARELNSRGYDLHLWSVVKTGDEGYLIASAAMDTRVKSVVLDVEPFTGFWTGTPADVERLMVELRTRLGQKHIGISVDPRRAHYSKIYPDIWIKYADSIHPQCYWGIMKRTPESVVDEAFAVWGDRGLPVLPVLQAHDVPADELTRALDRATRLGAPSVSLWRTGLILPTVIMTVEDWWKNTNWI